MPDEETPSDAGRPSLEPPKLFGRRRSPRARPAPDPAPAEATVVPPAVPTPIPEPAPVREPDPVREPSPVPEPDPIPEPDPVREPAPVPEPEPIPEPDPVREPAPVPEPEPIPEPEPTVAVADVEPRAGTEPAFADAGNDAPDAASAATRGLRAPRLGRRPASRAPASPAASTGSGTDDGDTVVEERVPDPAPARERPAPPLTGLPAALAVGALVGVVLVALTLLGTAGCDAVRGTSSCGTGAGMTGLVVILALAIVAGGVLLRFVQVPDPGATSFLAVCLVGVVTLLVLVDVLDSRAMLVVIPVLGALSYGLSWWVTTTFVDTDD
ncbi:hypothetical protein [Nocardioides sp. 1609]|uniref:hypothetical protein n=1 Tax=Nocardioides sp. 1609 TaxID=2508327 RepID=UPI00106FCCD2|nr:hypothetical protein [Nocardioides sp. 1609]